MKSILVIFACCVFAVFPAIASADELGDVRLSLLEGDVQIFHPDADDWETASVNMPLDEGTRISLPADGKAELQIRGGVYIRLDGGTTFELVTVSEKEAHFYLDQGHIYINNKRGGIQWVQVDTPLASFNCADNSITLVDVADAGATELSVVKGFAYLESRQGKTRVARGSTLKVTENSAEIAPIAAPDEWERWNTEQDRRALALGQSARYLPDELHEYSNDFDSHGQWTFVSDYGYVWRPTVVEFDWAPFRLGRWTWVRGDYVWVSDERWGWAPYHYGRWAYLSGTGWCWVPPRPGAVAWGPGFVAWVRTGDTVGWVPLAPGEIYYGRRQYGPGTVVITTATPSTRVQGLRNARVNNAATVVPLAAFTRGERTHTIIRGNSLPQAAATAPVLPPAAPRPTRTPAATRGTTLAPPSVTVPRTPSAAPAPEQSRSAATPPPSKTLVMPVVPPQPTGGEKRVAPEQRGPRRFVRDSNQSAFREEHPRQLPVKQLQEPKPVNRSQPERTKQEKNGRPAPGGERER